MTLTHDLNRIKADLEHPHRLYLISNPSSGMLKDIYLFSNNEYRAALFDNTRLANLKDNSPWITEIDEQSPLLKHFEKNALNDTGWQGILIYIPTSVSFNQLLKQLRHRLFINYGDQQKGVLHFQLPQVLHYLLKETPQSEAESWLGNITASIWKSPLSSLSEGSVWQSISKEASSEPTELTEDYSLSPKQEQAFVLQQLDQYILAWAAEYKETDLNLSDLTQLREILSPSNAITLLNQGGLTSLFIEVHHRSDKDPAETIQHLKALPEQKRRPLLQRMKTELTELTT
ncbi:MULTISPECIES: DUF4123 domain-containing protein [unclassified Neptuniibacter]|uniref:DUF4123 domain-containing protein n=1 Tax=unclassified Neptuniibacter TaxID=2630693 RepID=UPI0025FCC541|nr:MULTISPECIES: DUF4123 domain-containing protein [unclassified Neptuniibacter]|tara:strand:- start:4598 stop:5461 length:864 start_codon:yes stop_codon:yes gene_type:complete